MSITSTSLSFTFVNMYAAPSAKQTAPAERCAPAEPAPSHSCGEGRPAARQNRLVEAMMSALRELGFGNEATQPAPAAATAAPAAAMPSAPTNAADAAAALATGQASAAAAVAESAAATANPSATDANDVAEAPQVSIESAVREFAHELFSALRQMGRGESSERGSERGSDRVHGDGGRHHHPGHHGWRREGYGDMAQRLNALSQTFAAPAAVAAASAAPVSTSISITLTIQNSAAPMPAQRPAQVETTDGAIAADVESAQATPSTATFADEPMVSGTSVPAAPASTTSAAASLVEAARNPLLDAFSQLFGALKPQAAQTDMADKLRTFLQTLAQAMRPDSMGQGNPMPQVGALVNVTA